MLKIFEKNLPQNLGNFLDQSLLNPNLANAFFFAKQLNKTTINDIFYRKID